MILKDKVAIVTGASRGIGREIALRLAREGAQVAFNYLQAKEAAESLLKGIESSGAEAMAAQCDVRDFAAVKEWVESVRQRFGRLDILVNNAGVLRDKAFMLMEKNDWDAVVDTNLNGLFNVTRACIVTFLKQKSGQIVNISSVSGIIGTSRQTNYAASKAGIIGFTKSFAREVGPYNIRVNAVAPGYIETEMVTTFKEDYKKQLLEKIPLKRFGAAKEVADAVMFLLSPAGKYITGGVLVVDGGLSMR
ncbi:MAG: 3-oxoacyl-[acyl-carrier-protein] reductase [Candidatus Omnitrophota bacterium]